MGTALSVLLFALKCIGIILLVVLVLLIIALFTPVGIDLLWEPARYTVHARFGPLRYLLMPREEKAQINRQGNKSKKKTDEPNGTKQASAPEPSVVIEKNGEEPTARAGSSPDGKKADETPADGAKQEEGNHQDGIKENIQLILNDLKKNPFETIQQLLDEFAPLIGRLLHGIHIRHLCVLWTITGEDAAETAISYGRAMAISNNVMARMQELMDIKADNLRLEPDFANQLAEKRHLSCQITVRPCIILIIGIKLLWHFWHLRKKR